jgi:flagellar M-ring protein FliF
MADTKSTLRGATDALKSLGSGSRAVALLVLLAIAGVLGTSAYIARQPHFELLYSGLDATDSARVQKALSDAGIAFEASQPPAPFSVFVDTNERHSAFAAVASSGALAGRSGGIASTESGMSTVFLSQAERAQVVRKRDWEETELLLEGLDFVADARVRTSSSDEGPWGRDGRTRASVTLTLRGRAVLSTEQTLAVAGLVRNALGVDPADLVITDQIGTSLYDGAAQTGDAAQSAAWLAHKSRFDRELADRANRLLSDILGADRARVTVSSDWSFEQTSSVSESTDPQKRVAVSEESSASATPGASGGVGGAAGTASNISSDDFGLDHAAVADSSGSNGADAGIARSEESRNEYYVPKSTVATVNRSPVLKRLSVSLFLDESLADRQKELESSIKAAVGYDESRKDAFSAVKLPFNGVTVRSTDGASAADGADAGAQAPQQTSAPDAPPSRLVQLLLDRGVEIVAAIAFVFVLLRTVRGPRAPKADKKKGKGAADATANAADANGAAGADAAGASAARRPSDELVPAARVKVSELVKQDPERVGRILSDWARPTADKAGTRP